MSGVCPVMISRMTECVPPIVNVVVGLCQLSAVALCLVPPIGIVPEKDHTGGQLHPAEIPPGGAVQPAGDPTELGQEGMATLHRTANPTDPGLPGLAPLGGLPPEARRSRPLLAGAVAVGPLGPRVWQVTGVRLDDSNGCRRLDE